jgi:hypothetical protein
MPMLSKRDPINHFNEPITNTFDVDDPDKDIAIASSRSDDDVTLNRFDR